MKRFFIFCTVFFISFFNISYADDLNEEEYFNAVWEDIINIQAEISDNISLNSKHVIAIDKDSKTILYEKNAYVKTKFASTTKIMTSIIVLENANLEEEIIVCKEAALTGGSRLGLKTNDKIKIKDLLYGLLLKSGNDAAVQLAISISGSIEDFSNLMNNKAQELNLKNTHFVNPHGLDKEEHFTTAYELALITEYALNLNLFKEIVNTKTYTIFKNGYPITISNTNELLGYLDGVNGVKTGFTNGAGRCLVTSVSRNNFNIICVVLGADTKKFRTQDSIKVIEYVYKNYQLLNISKIINEEYLNFKQIQEKRISVYKGITSSVKINLAAPEQIILPIKTTNLNKINCIIDINYNLVAPIFQGTKIGTLKVFIDKIQVQELDISLANSVRKKELYDYFYDLCYYIKKIY